MPTIKLTQPAVDNLKPPRKGRVEYWDNQLPGFGLRISDSGRKTWVAMYRVSGKLMRETIGTTATIPKVSEARDLARGSLQTAQKGINPVQAKRQASQAVEAAAVARETLGEVIDRYLGQHAARRMRADSFAEVKRSLTVDVKAKLGTVPIAELTRRQLRDLLDEIVGRGRAPHAHHVLAYLRPALAWAVEREIVGANVAVEIPDPDVRKRDARSRDRYLDDEEIRHFWQACEAVGWPFGPLFRLLLLTGQRRDELAQAKWPEFDFDGALWTLPRERVKNNKAHLVHLSPLAVEILRTLPRGIGKVDFLFTTTGNSPVSGFGRAQARLLEEITRLRKAEMSLSGRRAEIPHFVIHDLRRTTATQMAGLGIAQHVVEKVLNHTGGKISGVAAVYNRFEYLDERRAALEAWSRRVETLIGRAASNVVQLAAAR